MVELFRHATHNVPREQYGTWCSHGYHLLVIDPTDHTDYPGVIPANPWPCDQGCTMTDLIDDEEVAGTYYYA
jgi:hypothetical protein